MELFKLFGTIAIDANGAIHNLGKVSAAGEDTEDKLDRTKDASKRLESGFTVLKGVAANLATQGLAKVANALGQLIGNAAGYMNQIEQYQTSFATMTGSEEKALEVTERLKEIGAATPFELTDLADATQLLMNYGFTADEAVDSMMMLGDISQGDADKMNRIAMAYGQMSSAGKVSLEDIKQMIEAGFNPLQEISDATGESMESLYARISNGTLSVDEITASLQRSTSEGGKYFGSMDAQSKTFNGRLSTLKETANESLGNILAPLLEKAANEWFPALTEAVSTVDEKFQTFMAWLDENQWILVTLGSVIGVITVALGAHSAAVALAAAMEAAEVTSLGALISAKYADAAASLAALAPYLLIATAIAAVIAIGVLLVKNWDTVKAKCVELWNGITEAFNNIKETVVSVWDGIWSSIKGVINNIIGGVENMVNRVIDGINGLLSGVSMIVSAVGSVLGLDWSIGQIQPVTLPRLAKGGVLEEGQMGLLEGSGAEAVVPLDQNHKWIAAVAKDMESAGIGGNNAQAQRIIELLEMLVDMLPDTMKDAFAAMKFDVNNREFARLVKAVN